MDTDVRWHYGQTLAAGQMAEFKVWAELVRQSMGGLHVFLPLRDMGIDAVIHRLADGSYVAVQVKARTSLTPAGQVHITVTANSLVDDKALVVATLVDGEQLGPFLLVVDEAHHLSPELLEEVRLLTNLETTQQKLLQIVLAGQPELEEKLRDPRLRQLRQRITMRCRTQPLSLEELAGYIAERLRIGGADVRATVRRRYRRAPRSQGR